MSEHKTIPMSEIKAKKAEYEPEVYKDREEARKAGKTNTAWDARGRCRALKA